MHGPHLLIERKDAQHCIYRTDVVQTVAPATKAAHQPVYLRTSRLPAPKANIAPKITQVLAELGITHSRLVMPTRENCAQLEGLFDAAAALVDTKKVVDKVDQEIRVLKARMAGRASVGARSDAMDADDNDGDGGEGEPDGDSARAHSVAASALSIGRKRVRGVCSLVSRYTADPFSSRSDLSLCRHRSIHLPLLPHEQAGSGRRISYIATFIIACIYLLLFNYRAIASRIRSTENI